MGGGIGWNWAGDDERDLGLDSGEGGIGLNCEGDDKRDQGLDSGEGDGGGVGLNSAAGGEGGLDWESEDGVSGSSGSGWASKLLRLIFLEKSTTA